MKNYFLPLFSLLLLVMSACNSSENTAEAKKEDITGTWTLFKETKKGETIDYSGVPSASRIEFKENGYFVYFDQITDEKINNSGIGSIQDNLKGQYELKDGFILLNHYNQDTLLTKTFVLKSLKDGELVLKDEESDKLSYYKK